MWGRCRGRPEQVGQSAHVATGALVKEVGLRGERARFVCAQAQRRLGLTDDLVPVLARRQGGQVDGYQPAVGGVCHHGSECRGVADASEGEGRRDTVAQVVQDLGHRLAGPARTAQVLDLVDQDQPGRGGLHRLTHPTHQIGGRVRSSQRNTEAAAQFSQEQTW